MRLLQRKDDGEYSLTEFVGDAIPRYAILSHTWGADHEEVTLADLEKDTGTTKAGYKKLYFCGDQAAKDVRVEAVRESCYAYAGVYCSVCCCGSLI
jgi:hypothetical protein